MIDGYDIVNILADLKKRGADINKLAEVHALLRIPEIEVRQDHAFRIQQILLGAYKEERNITQEVRDWVLTTSGYFATTDCYKDLSLTTKDHKKAATMALLRLEKEGIIEKYGQKRGMYRLVERDIDQMDFKNADPDDYLKFRFPLGVERKTRIFPKSIVVIAGVTGTGKTSYILDFIQQNMNDNRIIYFNSEMSAQAMHFKLQQFNSFPVFEWTFEMRQWRGNPASIEPDAVNIIDYMHAGKNAYDIQEPMGKIIDRLNHGIAVVAIQKKPGAEYGTGGIYSSVDACLTINLEWKHIEVKKNRFRETDEFPGLDHRDFDIRQGNVVALSGWYSESKQTKEKGFVRERNLKAVGNDEPLLDQEGREA
ncbi:MAG: hypothetical protein A4E57_00002 [Syntrophorhabdaceae bacterium PtaU1.Bin034]|nr:MAG: hypothetical protein A4E57_00002 [Syntrophorhabdaceae bacterium PtaU1.Bin034]